MKILMMAFLIYIYGLCFWRTKMDKTKFEKLINELAYLIYQDGYEDGYRDCAEEHNIVTAEAVAKFYKEEK
jgi:hypothetical protein